MTKTSYEKSNYCTIDDNKFNSYYVRSNSIQLWTGCLKITVMVCCYLFVKRFKKNSILWENSEFLIVRFPLHLENNCYFPFISDNVISISSIFILFYLFLRYSLCDSVECIKESVSSIFNISISFFWEQTMRIFDILRVFWCLGLFRSRVIHLPCKRNGMVGKGNLND